MSKIAPQQQGNRVWQRGRVAAWQTGNMTISLRMMTIREASEADADSFFASYFLIMQHGCRCECGSVICKQYNLMCMCVCVLHTKVISAAKAIKFERQVALLEARIVSLPVVAG